MVGERQNFQILNPDKFQSMVGKGWYTSARKPTVMIIEDLSLGAERFPVPVYITSENDNDLMDIRIFEKFKYAPRIVDSAGHVRKRQYSPGFSCHCSGKCSTTNDCDCSSGVYTKDGVVEDMEKLMYDTVRECNENCGCALWCGNRVAQKGACYPVEVFSRDWRCGWGVRASTVIPMGTYIGEYTGELIDDDEAGGRDTTFLFETRIGTETFTIDAKNCGNYTRFINHSCDPNVKVANVSWDLDENQLVHMCFYTSRDIDISEEFTIDYGEAWWINKKFPCLCGSECCRYAKKGKKYNKTLNELELDVSKLKLLI